MSSLARVHCDLIDTCANRQLYQYACKHTQSMLCAYLEGVDADLQLSGMCNQN